MLDESSGGRVTVRTGERAAAVQVLAEAGATVAVVDLDTLTVSGMDAGDVGARLAAAGVPCSELSRHRASLEEVYMDMTRRYTTFADESQP